MSIKDVAIMVRSNVTRYFHFQVRKVSILHEPGVVNIKNVFPNRPVFYLTLPNYDRSDFSMSDYMTQESQYQGMDRSLLHFKSNRI